ncbi:MAG TPA: hypothetical protein VNT56_06375 [Acidimicrobiales bacterium]|nr:hypothetical protein [Acidimicrobiales bacterium]
MPADVATALEALIAGEGLWHDEGGLETLVSRLAEASDPASLTLAAVLGSLLARRRRGPVPVRLAADIDGVVYPRLWKILEAVWDELPASEVRVRLDSLAARLAPLLERAA